MSIKSIAFAAIAAATVATTSSAAETTFNAPWRLEAGTVLNLGLIRSEGDGVVEVYDFHTGQQGRLLGSTNLNAGANNHVRVNTGGKTSRNVLAVVVVGGQVVATKDFVVR
ncbi:hypothetical protein ACJ5NV_09595 [Loktanella agnita]|uniref:hypothetical protein n=1 Tax=Loktanella agnita TaxID=287097 RepID=UPI00398768FE